MHTCAKDIARARLRVLTAARTNVNAVDQVGLTAVTPPSLLYGRPNSLLNAGAVTGVSDGSNCDLLLLAAVYGLELLERLANEELSEVDDVRINRKGNSPWYASFTPCILLSGILEVRGS